MSYYLVSKEDVLKKIDASEGGLTTAQANERIEKYGKNKLKEAEKESLFKKFIKSLADPMIIMLLAAAGITIVTTFIERKAAGEPITGTDLADFFIILVVVIINTVLSLVQESKAESAIDALKEMTAATSKVIRDGEVQVIKSEDITIGDVVVFEAGDAVPADCRILESYSMKVEEAALTGESVPVTKLVDLLTLKEGEKDVALGDRKNMMYSGSTVVYGRGKAVVTAIGMDTEMGKIAEALSQSEAEQTPLQIKMGEISKTLTKIVIGICLFMFAYGIVTELISFEGGFHFAFEGWDVLGMAALDTFILAVALAVAAIPEGLPAVVTIILSLGVTSMSKRQALIRKLTAVETLGCTQVICSDKTGTLTQNKMTVVDKTAFDESLLARCMTLCNDATVKPGETQATGEPTECALVNYGLALNMPKYELEAEYPRIGEAPFDSGRKMMSTVHNHNGQIIQYTKGACEIIVKHCTHYIDTDGTKKPVDDAFRAKLSADIKGFADRALRVLGAAYREYDAAPASFDAEALEDNMTFIGFVGMIDPCRPEVKPAIAECRKAGIRPIMITGDHKDTAVAIAKDLGIITDASEAILGADLEDYTDEELVELVTKYSVYARVQPEHKTRIVKAWKARGQVTAMTGDGVNDAPSIKAADIGIGMGITGTDVTKGVSDMVLADDNFATIVNAVEEGRKIYDNVRKVLGFQLSTNMAEILVMFISAVLKLQFFSAPHLLWINMVTDSVPGLALGMEKAESNLMSRKPRPANESVFANGAGFDMITQGFFLAAVVIASYFIGVNMATGGASWDLALIRSDANVALEATTMAFLTMNFMEIFKAICMRSQHGSIFTMKTQNWWLIGAFVLTAILTLIVVCVEPLARLFSLAPLALTFEHVEGCLSLTDLLIAFGLGFSVVPGLEIIKIFLRMNDKKKGRVL